VLPALGSLAIIDSIDPASTVSSSAASRPTSSTPTPISKPRSPAPPTGSSSTTDGAATLGRACTSRSRSSTTWLGGVADVAKSIKVGPGTASDVQMGPTGRTTA